MSPFAATGTFTSRVFDAGGPGADWLRLTATASVPGGAAQTLETRSGGTPTPDGSWSGWEAVGADDAIASPNARYLEYRSTLSSTNNSVTPTLEQVNVVYRP